eukprot:CAMPEP_0178394958 /NCGR_PEP_ID=MMETSP0689_2-20121128/12974_1 /TAXON_ID=160604 /ORGANISM="Amphidinium massartii, Strain CS-259" /LENGTH=89 /DNA_ID=CAMNT_0020015603 /DNA_START=324 /DNA_END=592 /DNA_ORIENTATION=+
MTASGKSSSKANSAVAQCTSAAGFLAGAACEATSADGVEVALILMAALCTALHKDVAMELTERGCRDATLPVQAIHILGNHVLQLARLP